MADRSPRAAAEASAPAASHRPGALALVLFGTYLAVYSAFVIVAAFFTFSGGQAAGGLATRSAGGVPLGVLAGLGLIVGAFALALVYAAFGPRADAEAGRSAGGELSVEDPRAEEPTPTERRS